MAGNTDMSIPIPTNEKLSKYEIALIKYGECIAKGQNIADYARKELDQLGFEVHALISTVSAEEIEAAARALFDFAVEERNTFFAFHQETGTQEFKFEGLMRERFIKQATTALTATGKPVLSPKAGA